MRRSALDGEARPLVGPPHADRTHTHTAHTAPDASDTTGDRHERRMSVGHCLTSHAAIIRQVVIPSGTT